jgi:S-adenosylmethionine hydrolase
MPTITLTSDLGERDHYVAAVKGNLLRQCPDVSIIDISHQVTPFDIFQAAFVLQNAYRHFPGDTIHLVSVESSARGDDKILLLHFDGHYFIGYDNGIFSLIFQDQPEAVYELKRDHVSHPTFLFRDVMVQSAIDLLKGKKPEEVGNKMAQIKQREPLKPVISDHSIRGNIVYFDHYGNAMTNIKEPLYKSIGRQRRFRLHFKRNESLQEVSTHYNSVPEGEKLCLFNTSGYLEIAINKGEARKLFGLNIGDIVQMDFES